MAKSFRLWSIEGIIQNFMFDNPQETHVYTNGITWCLKMIGLGAMYHIYALTNMA
jgi:hypothetical protein